jgi:hypothetical protein
MFEPVRPRRGTVRAARSRAAIEVALNLYALLGMAVIARLLLLALRVDDRIWVGERILGTTNLLVAPFAMLPGASRTLFQGVTLADLTLAAAVVLVPLGLLARKTAGSPG